MKKISFSWTFFCCFLLGTLFFAFPFCLTAKAATPSFARSQEMRVGILRHDVKSGFRHSHEKSCDLNAEFLFSSFSGDIARLFFSPRLHVGTSLNMSGATHQGYTGLTWHVPLGVRFFVEASLGGCIHTGETKKQTKNKKALGSRLLFRESLALGWQTTEQMNISLLLDHASNAKLARPNPGLTSVGIRLGYVF